MIRIFFFFFFFPSFFSFCFTGRNFRNESTFPGPKRTRRPSNGIIEPASTIKETTGGSPASGRTGQSDGVPAWHHTPTVQFYPNGRRGGIVFARRRALRIDLPWSSFVLAIVKDRRGPKGNRQHIERAKIWRRATVCLSSMTSVHGGGLAGSVAALAAAAKDGALPFIALLRHAAGGPHNRPAVESFELLIRLGIWEHVSPCLRPFCATMRSSRWHQSGGSGPTRRSPSAPAKLICDALVTTSERSSVSTCCRSHPKSGLIDRFDKPSR